LGEKLERRAAGSYPLLIPTVPIKTELWDRPNDHGVKPTYQTRVSLRV